MELRRAGRYERHGCGRPVVILSNPQADPAWWAPPFISAWPVPGMRPSPSFTPGPPCAPAHVVGDVATFAELVRMLGWFQGTADAQEVALLQPDLVAAAALSTPMSTSKLVPDDHL